MARKEIPQTPKPLRRIDCIRSQQPLEPSILGDLRSAYVDGNRSRGLKESARQRYSAKYTCNLTSAYSATSALIIPMILLHATATPLPVVRWADGKTYAEESVLEFLTQSDTFTEVAHLGCVSVQRTVIHIQPAANRTVESQVLCFSAYSCESE